MTEKWWDLASLSNLVHRMDVNAPCEVSETTLSYTNINGEYVSLGNIDELSVQFDKPEKNITDWPEEE
jgi:hypothetical protein